MTSAAALAARRYRCHQCAAPYGAWQRTCDRCACRLTLLEDPAVARVLDLLDAAAPMVGARPAVALPRTSTGLAGLDLLTGGGLVRPWLLVLTGPPQSGKTTLALQLAAATGWRTLVATAEQSHGAVRRLAAAVGAHPTRTRVLEKASLALVPMLAAAMGARLVILDSAQELAVSDSDQAVAAVAAAARSLAYDTAALVVLIGHYTKDGGPAGPKRLEHRGDGSLSLEPVGDGPGLVRITARKYRDAVPGLGVTFAVDTHGFRDLPPNGARDPGA